MRDIVARARDDIWFASLLRTYRYNGSTFSPQELTPTAGVGPAFLWRAGQDLLASEQSSVYRWSSRCTCRVAAGGGAQSGR